MVYDNVTFKQDLRAATNALETEDFENLNILSNRIMSNSIFGDKKEYGLIGFFLKEVSFFVGNMKFRTPTSAFSTSKALAEDFAKKLADEKGNLKFEGSELWMQFHVFMEKIRKFTFDEYEEKAYDEPRYTFTHDAFLWLIDYLEHHKEILIHPRNLMVKGILNEMSRIYRSHGAKIEETYILAVITALDWCSDYVRLVAADSDEFSKRVREEIFPLVERGMLTLRQPTADDVADLTWQLIKKWREYFIQFMERRRVSLEKVYETEKGIEIPEETKKKLTEALTRSLEKEAKPRK